MSLLFRQHTGLRFDRIRLTPQCSGPMVCLKSKQSELSLRVSQWRNSIFSAALKTQSRRYKRTMLLMSFATFVALAVWQGGKIRSELPHKIVRSLEPDLEHLQFLVVNHDFIRVR